MKKTINIPGRKKLNVPVNIVDSAINFFNPVLGQKRYRARVSMALAGSYDGASKSKTYARRWQVTHGDSNSDTLCDLPELRYRSRDQIRNNPLATGAQNTTVTSVIGSGLKLRSKIDRKFLGLTDDQADVLEDQIEREWGLFIGHECDAARTLPFYGIQELVFRQVFENGDIFVNMPRFSRAGSPYKLKIQLIEADRVSNPNNGSDTDTTSGGIEKDSNGAPSKVWISDNHPGSDFRTSGKWTGVKAFAPNGRPNILHIFKQLRPGQSRGVPALAPVLESLKQLGRYTEAELMAAVVSGMFTVFVRTENGDLDLSELDLGQGKTTGSDKNEEYQLGNGAIVGLAEDQTIETANPGRPNAGFDPFVLSILRQIGTALELPFEILVKHFTASYSAAKAALEEAWKFFRARRKWIITELCQPIYCEFLAEIISSGRIAAPGFFDNELIRQAYCGSEWYGDGKPQLDETKAITAAEKRVAMTVSTLQEETAVLTGGDWEKKLPQRDKENKLLIEAGLVPIETAPAASDPDGDGDAGGDGDDLAMFTTLKANFDAYGVGVRSGSITPQTVDEGHYRELAGLPAMSQEVEEAWAEDGGTRRPITLQSGEAFQSQQEGLTDEDEPQPQEDDDE